jgi:hypothetical protein
MAGMVLSTGCAPEGSPVPTTLVEAHADQSKWWRLSGGNYLVGDFKNHGPFKRYSRDTKLLMTLERDHTLKEGGTWSFGFDWHDGMPFGILDMFLNLGGGGGREYLTSDPTTTDLAEEARWIFWSNDRYIAFPDPAGGCVLAERRMGRDERDRFHLNPDHTVIFPSLDGEAARGTWTYDTRGAGRNRRGKVVIVWNGGHRASYPLTGGPRFECDSR